MRPANNQVTLKFVLKKFVLLIKLTIDLLFNIFLMTSAYWFFHHIVECVWLTLYAFRQDWPKNPFTAGSTNLFILTSLTPHIKELQTPLQSIYVLYSTAVNTTQSLSGSSITHCPKRQTNLHLRQTKLSINLSATAQTQIDFILFPSSCSVSAPQT